MEKIPVRHIQASAKELKTSELFNMRDLRNLLAGYDLVQELHRHDFFYLLALKKVTGKHEIDFTPYKINDHSVFFMRPGQVHQLTLKAGSSGYLMEFKTDFYHPHSKTSEQLLRKVSSRNHYQLDAHGFKKLFAILTSIFQEHADKKAVYEEVIKANLDILLIELVRQNSQIVANETNTYAQERLEELMELLATHIADHKQVSQYADMLNFSVFQLNAITKTTLGKTCSEVINEYIILESKRYLLATSNQVNQVAYHLGYEDVSYFIRLFKKHTGYTPEAFRNKFR